MSDIENSNDKGRESVDVGEDAADRGAQAERRAPADRSASAEHQDPSEGGGPCEGSRRSGGLVNSRTGRTEKRCDSDTWWEERSLGEKIGLGLGFGILGIGFVAALGLVVMLLWNYVMPDLLGVGRLTYWKAWALLVLCWILLKSWGSASHGRYEDRKRKKKLRRLIRDDQAATSK
ncbi:MAG: hypothetical protein RBU30_27125 [Polyangia bacterium]|mgnify:CR=1 FL=1|jgi:hypothetical protein|nr:hypothetical protein [Polyangia bacterium]